MSGTYRAAWPVTGLLGRREAIRLAAPKLRRMLADAGLTRTALPRWRIRDADDTAARLWPGEPVDQVLTVTVPVTTATEAAA